MASKGLRGSKFPDELDTKLAIVRKARRILEASGLNGLSVRAAGLSARVPYPHLAHGLAGEFIDEGLGKARVLRKRGQMRDGRCRRIFWNC